MGLHTMADPMGKHAVLHFPWVWSTAAWPAVQAEDRRTRNEERRRKEGEEGPMPTELPYILRQHIKEAVQVLHGEV